MTSKRFLDKINYPADLRNFSKHDLSQISQELREELIEVVSKTGGHLGAGLGVVELTIALHYVFNTPKDKIIWDIGHQAYPHKILTGRRQEMHSLRQENGLSGFLKISESEYDHFGAGHSSTAISAALGMAVARDMHHENHEIVAVIGDGAISAGLAYEALNNTASCRKRVIVVLNDNKMSISPAVGAMSNYLAKLVSSEKYLAFRNLVKHSFNQPLCSLAKKAEHLAKSVTSAASNIFEDLGFYYIGPVDGHNIEELVEILSNIHQDKTLEKPILLHVITEKGKGFQGIDKNSEKAHAVSKFNPKTWEEITSNNKKPSYSEVFGKYLTQMAKEDESIIAITAAMLSGTGLNNFATEIPDRVFDVGIAEQHAVTFAAGLATQGMKPFVAIYSTFLQRAYDQVIHDVAIQNLPVRFILDRAGPVGQDGPTHAGSFDIAYLGCIPNLILMAPSDEQELVNMLATSQTIDYAPTVIRFPRGEIYGDHIPTAAKILPIGKGRIVKQYHNTHQRVAILSYGTRLADSLKAASMLSEENIGVTIADARFAKPLDKKLIEELAKNHEALITVEEGSIGGFGSYVAQYLHDHKLFLSHKLQFKQICLPDYFIEHKSYNQMIVEAEMDSLHIYRIAKNLLIENHVAA